MSDVCVKIEDFQNKNNLIKKVLTKIISRTNNPAYKYPGSEAEDSLSEIDSIKEYKETNFEGDAIHQSLIKTSEINQTRSVKSGSIQNLDIRVSPKPVFNLNDFESNFDPKICKNPKLSERKHQCDSADSLNYTSETMYTSSKSLSQDSKKEFNFNSKISELENLKENNKLLREIRQSKERLRNDNPQSVMPYLTEKFSRFELREPYIVSRRSYSPAESVTPRPLINPFLNKEYLEMIASQREAFESGFQKLKNMEERTNQHLSERFDQLIRIQDEKEAKNLEEIRKFLTIINETQMDLQSNSTPPFVTELRKLKNQYLIDGGSDSKILMDIDMLIEQMKRKTPQKSSKNSDWKETRRNMALLLEKSNELRDLERQNNELEKQIAIDKVRAEYFKEKNLSKNDNLETTGLSKMESLQQQIQILQQEINDLKQPKNSPTPETSQNLPSPKPDDNKDNIDFDIVLLHISGVGQYVTSATIVLSILKDNETVLNPVILKPSSIKQMKMTDLDLTIILNLTQSISKCPISNDTFALVQLKVKTTRRNQFKLESYTKINFFDDGELKEGIWEQKLFTTPLQLNATDDELTQYHRAVLHYKITRRNNDVTNDISDSSKPKTKSNKKKTPSKVENSQTTAIVSDDEKLAEIIDLDKRPEFGFQVIRVKNIANGDGMLLGKLRLTVYHTLGPQKGQTVLCSTGPVTCCTNAVRADVKIACYQFGRQLGKFTEADLTVDCKIIARFYLEDDDGRLSSTDKGQSVAPNEVLLAWTALTLVKHRKIAKNNPNYYTDHLKILKINEGLFDLPLYELPVTSPESLTFDQDGQLIDHKKFGRAKLKLRVFHTESVDESATSSDEMSDNDFDNKNKIAWISVEREEPVLLPYLQDDGIDLYLDYCRLLPDTVTIIKIEAQIVNRSLQSQGPKFSAISLITSDIFNPEFNKRVEIREPSLSPSSTLLLKIFTFDREDKNLVILGYAALNIFVETGTNQQPTYDNLGVLKSLNDGGHQIRIYSSGPGDNVFPFTESWFENNNVPYIPGASVLIRLYKALKTIDGRPISIDELPQNQWKSTGLVIPAPKYESGYYYSISCKPNDEETQILLTHINRPKLLTQDLISSKWSEKLKEVLPFDEVLGANNLFKLFDKFIPGTFNLNHVAHYIPTHGFKILVDGCVNIPWAGYSMGHISIYPPGALYMNKPQVAYDRPFLICQLDLDSTPSAPIWRDGWKTYRKRRYDKGLVAILHVHEMNVQKDSNNNFTFSLENQAWIPIQIFDGSYCITKATQMPLIVGSPKLSFLQELRTKTVQQFLNDNLSSKKIIYLKNASVIIRQCDSRRVIEVSPSLQNKLNLDQKYIPQKELSAYQTVYKSKKEVMFSKSLPVGLNSDSIHTLLKLKFKTLIYKFYNDNGFYLTQDNAKK